MQRPGPTRPPAAPTRTCLRTLAGALLPTCLPTPAFTSSLRLALLAAAPTLLTGPARR